MLTKQRKQWILGRLAQDGEVIAKTVSRELSVSEDTIRRDLRELALEGLLQRVHGGALPASSAMGDLQTRTQIATDDKIALGRAGANLVKPGQLVILDGGTTAFHLARQLPPNLRATFVTHSPTIAVELAKHARLDIIMLGGQLFRHSMVNVGATVIESAARIRADLYFMGVTGVHAKTGLTTGDHEEAAVKRALHHRAAETVVLASHEKLGAASPFLVAELSEISVLVLPPDSPDKLTKLFRTKGLRVLVAD